MLSSYCAKKTFSTLSKVTRKGETKGMATCHVHVMGEYTDKLFVMSGKGGSWDGELTNEVEAECADDDEELDAAERSPPPVPLRLRVVAARSGSAQLGQPGSGRPSPWLRWRTSGSLACACRPPAKRRRVCRCQEGRTDGGRGGAACTQAEAPPGSGHFG